MGGGAGKPLQSTQLLPLSLCSGIHSCWPQGGQSETQKADPRYYLFMTPSDQGLGPVSHLLLGERAQRAIITVTC